MGFSPSTEGPLWHAQQKAPRVGMAPGASWFSSGDTYSRTFGTTIGSGSLTTVFGMGTGVAFQIWSPERGSRRC